MPAPSQPVEGEDYYWDGPYMVFTAAYHLKRGYCCQSGCRHCPFEAEPAQPTPKAKDSQELLPQRSVTSAK